MLMPPTGTTVQQRRNELARRRRRIRASPRLTAIDDRIRESEREIRERRVAIAQRMVQIESEAWTTNSEVVDNRRRLALASARRRYNERTLEQRLHGSNVPYYEEEEQSTAPESPSA